MAIGLDNEENMSFDTSVVAYLAAHRVEWLTVAMRGVSLFGEGWVVAVLVLASGLFFRVRERSFRPLLLLAAAAAGAGLLDFVLKVIVARPRPPAMWMVGTAEGFSFPSGHAAGAAFWGALAFLSARSFHSSRLAVWVGAATVVLSIGLSRVYLGMHWPSDVLVGWGLAAAWLSSLCVGIRALERRAR